MRIAVHIERTETDRPGLERGSCSCSASVRWRERSQMGLRAAEGRTNQAMAQARGTDPNQVGRWRRRLAEQGLEGMVKERPRGGHHGGICSQAQAGRGRGRAGPLSASCTGWGARAGGSRTGYGPSR